jgi:hypothetical protein
MTNKIKVSLQTGISEEKKSQLNPTNARANDGLYNSNIVEAIPQYNQGDGEKVIKGTGNQFIIMGRDRPRGLSSGYGGAGHTHAASIDIIAGMSGIMSREASADGQMIVTDKSPELDAARIYISQRSNIDDYFHLAEGEVGNSEAKSGIVIKADDVRLVARNGIKLVTGTDTNDSAGLPSTFISGIDLIAGNDDSGLEPMVKGDSLGVTLEELAELVQDLNGVVFSLVQSYLQLINALAVHTHVGAPLVGGPTSPSVDLALGCATQLGNLGSLSADLTAHQKNIIAWSLNSLYPWGENYFKSSYNNTN